MAVVKRHSYSSTFDPVATLAESARRHGFEPLARLLGKSLGLVYAKLHESVENKTPSLREAVAIVDATGDATLIERWAAHVGGVYIPLPQMQHGDDDVVEELLDMMQTVGEFAQRFKDSRADGVIDADEYARVQEAASGIHQKLGILMLDIEQQVREVPRAKVKTIRTA